MILKLLRSIVSWVISIKTFYDYHLKIHYFLIDQISEADEDFIFYLLIRSVEIFYRDYSRYPGENSDNIDSDVGLLKHVLNKFLNENKVQNFSIKDDFLIEM